MRTPCASALFALLLVIGSTAEAQITSFPEAVSAMEAIVFSNSQATRDNPDPATLISVLDFLGTQISTSATFQSAPSESAQPSPQAGPSAQATPQNSVPTMKGRWVVQYRYEYQWVPRKGLLGKMHYECVLVCRPVWVFEEAPESLPTRQAPVTSIIGLRLLALTLAADPAQITALNRRDLAIQIYSLTVTADDAFQAGQINRTSPIPTIPVNSGAVQ